MKLDELPAEILIEIFKNDIGLWSALSCRLVCQRFKDIVNSSDLPELGTNLEVQWSFEEYEEPEDDNPSCSVMLTTATEDEGLFVEIGIDDIKAQARNGLGFFLSFLQKITFYIVIDDEDVNEHEIHFESMHVELAAKIILELIKNGEIVVNRRRLQVALPIFKVSSPTTHSWIDYVNDFPELVDFSAIFVVDTLKKGKTITLGNPFKELLFESTSAESPFHLFKLTDPRFVSFRRFGVGNFVSQQRIKLNEDDIKMIGNLSSLKELRLQNVSINYPYWTNNLPYSLQALSMDNVHLPDPIETVSRSLDIQSLLVVDTIGSKLCNLKFPAVKTLTLGNFSCISCKSIVETIWPTVIKHQISIASWDQTDVFHSPGFTKAPIISLTIFKSRDQDDINIERLYPILQLQNLQNLSINSVRISTNDQGRRAIMKHLDDFSKMAIKQCHNLSSFHITIPNFPPIHLYLDQIQKYKTQSSPLYDPRQMLLDEFFREINEVS